MELTRPYLMKNEVETELQGNSVLPVLLTPQAITAVLQDQSFCDYFVRCGGGYHPTKATDIFTEEQFILHWSMTDEQWLEYPHYYVNGERIPEKETIAMLKVRNIQLEKIWKFYVGYLNNLPPMHPRTQRLYEQVKPQIKTEKAD